MATNFAPAGVKFVAQGVDNFLATFDKINKRIDKVNKNIKTFATRANTTLTGAVDKVFADIDKVTKFKGIKIKDSPFSRMGDQINSISNKAIPALLVALGTATVAAGALFGAGIATAVSFESAFAAVTKTVDTFIDRTATAQAGVITLTEAGKSFRQSLIELSQEIPKTFEDLSEIASLGGQLGIVEGLFGPDAEEALLSFTETVAGLAEATNLTQDKAATGLAQISNIYRGSVDDIGENVERLGATIVELGNTSATTESLILNFAQRIAGAGQTIGLTQAEVFGIGTAFASIGITAEAGSTAVNRSLLIMNEAVANSSGVFADNTSAILGTQEKISDLQADLVRLEAQTGITGRSLTAQRDAFLESGGAVEDFGRKLGDARREQLFQTQEAIDDLVNSLGTLRDSQGQAVTTEVFDELFRVIQNTEKGLKLSAVAFQELFKDDPAEAFALFVEGLAEEGDRAGQVLDKIGLGSVEATRAFLAIAGASETVRNRIDVANLSFEQNSALLDEVSVRYATLKSRLKTFENSIRAAANAIFSKLVPASIALVDEAQEIVQVLGDRIPAVIDLLVQRFFPVLQALFDDLDFSALDFSAIITSGFDALEGAINKINISALIDQAIFLRDNIVPVIVGAFEFAVEHSDRFFGAVKGLIALLGGIAFTGAVSTAVAALGWLTTPLGLATIAAVALGIAWETNFLNIQEVTGNVVSSVIGTIGELITKMGEFDFKGIFDNLFSGAEIESPEGFLLSGDAIGVGPESGVGGIFDSITAGAEAALAAIGKLVTLVIETPIDQVSGIIDIFQGLVDVFDGLTSKSLNIAKSLDGVQTAIGGFVDAVTAPISNLAALFGFDIDFQFLKDAGFKAAKDFVEGFLIGVTGIGGISIGDTFEEFIASLQELGESPTVQIFIDGLVQMWESLQGLGEAVSVLVLAVKELIGLKPDDSLLKFLGLVAGLAVVIVADELVAAVNALTGLVTILDGLLSLDLAKASEGLGMVGSSLVDGFIAPLQRIGELSGIDLESQMAELATKATESFLKFWNEGLDKASFAFIEWLGGIGAQVTLAEANLVLKAIVEVQEADEELTAWSQGLEDTLVLKFSVGTLELLETLTEIDTQLANWSQGLEDTLVLKFSVGTLDLLENLTEIDTQLTTWLDTKSQELVLFLSFGTLDLLENLTEIDTQLTTWLDTKSQELVLLLPPFSTEGLLENLTEIDTQLTTWVNTKSQELVLFLSVGTLDLLGDLTEIDTQLTTWIDGIALSMTGSLTGIWTDVDLGIPSFQAVLDKAKEIRDAIVGFFTNIFDGLSFDLPDFDLGILSKLDELGIIDLGLEVAVEVEAVAPDIDGLGTDLADGIIKEVEEAEQSWQDAWMEFLLAPIEAGKTALGIESPSTVTEAMAQDVILGYAKGLADLTPIEEAIIGVDSLILGAFQAFSLELLGVTIPTIQQTDAVFTTLHSETLPRVTSSLVDELTPAKQELAEVNVNELVPSVDLLIDAEERLITVFGDVIIKLDRVVGLKKEDKRRTKELTSEIDKLAKAYLALAAAIGSASEAGSGLTTPPGGPQTQGPGGPEFSSGGRFIVPRDVGVEGMPIRVHAGELVEIIPAKYVDQITSAPSTVPGFATGGSFIVPQGVGDEGMPIRVHSGELVEIIPAKYVDQITRVPDSAPNMVQSPAISGATINNSINNSNTSSENREYHLHVNESPSYNVRDSFELLEALT